ncbi:MAG: OmpA family protein [Magnetococcales bacterium]|nr:OmpA family protein [Magnetococcales bacterium]
MKIKILTASLVVGGMLCVGNTAMAHGTLFDHSTHAWHHSAHWYHNMSAAFVANFAPDGDSDNDGVKNAIDHCPATAAAAVVDRYGCTNDDADHDGVHDFWDLCPATDPLAKVDVHGCALDSDQDKVPDVKDDCPHSVPGVAVNAAGCALDTDADGVTDAADKCNDSARGQKVSTAGCGVAAVSVVNFDLGQSYLRAGDRKILNETAKKIKASPGTRFEIQGHADESGSAANNVGLSNRRAQEVRAYLMKQGIKAAQLATVGYGDTRPAAYNLTSEKDRQPINRRVEIQALPGNHSIRETDSMR